MSNEDAGDARQELTHMEVTESSELVVVSAAVLLARLEDTIVTAEDLTLDTGVSVDVVLDTGSRKTANMDTVPMEDPTVENLNKTVVEVHCNAVVEAGYNSAMEDRLSNEDAGDASQELTHMEVTESSEAAVGSAAVLPVVLEGTIVAAVSVTLDTVVGGDVVLDISPCKMAKRSRRGVS